MKEDEKKLKKIQVRLTESDLKKWREKSDITGVPMSDLVRNFMSNPRWKPADNRRQHKEKILALARIGNNLNQVAKWVNIYKSKADALEVLAALEAIKTECKDVDASI